MTNRRGRWDRRGKEEGWSGAIRRREAEKIRRSGSKRK
jgi:hypothetical protein